MKTLEQFRRRSRIGRRAQDGFTMVEVGLAITVLVVAVMAMSASTFRMHTLRRQNREITLAQNAARTIAEQVQALSYEYVTNAPDLAVPDPDRELWGQFVVDALTDGVGEIGSTFAVRELNVQEGQATVGSIQVVTNETVTDGALGVDLGMPRDLNGDGLADNGDVLATQAVRPPRLLPVVVTVAWRGVNGNRQIVHPFYVVGY